MARLAALALLLVAVAVARADDGDLAEDPDWPAFQGFLRSYGRSYVSAEETAGRFATFKANLRLAEARSAGSRSASHGVTKFSDLTPQEFARMYLGFRKSNSSFATAKAFPRSGAAAASLDWRQKGAVTPVKDQGTCGSCWAFSATEQVESDYFLKYGKLLELAPQQVVSCDKTDLGCDGGDTVTAFQYVHGAGGLDPESAYPYTSGSTGQTGRCKAVTADFDAGVAKAVYVSQSADQEASHMLQQVAQSPMSVCVDAETWQTYTGGVIRQADNCGTSLDHCVQVVGYNALQNYWLVRNSWGTDWGNGGYIWVEQGANVCGIAEEATVVVAAPPSRAALQV